MRILHYRRPNGELPFREWLAALRDTRAKAAILRRIDRLTEGNFGEHRPLRDGVWELKIDVGPGYRVYYAQAGEDVILLLCGGSKRTQQSDIARAVEYWNDYRERV